jgi:hypothetical protein
MAASGTLRLVIVEPSKYAADGEPTVLDNAGIRPGVQTTAAGQPSTEGKPSVIGNAGRRPAVTRLKNGVHSNLDDAPP